MRSGDSPHLHSPLSTVQSGSYLAFFSIEKICAPEGAQCHRLLVAAAATAAVVVIEVVAAAAAAPVAAPAAVAEQQDQDDDPPHIAAAEASVVTAHNRTSKDFLEL